jgi:hypothetical protein
MASYLLYVLKRLYLVFAILFGIAGIVQCVRWCSASGTITIWYLINFLPTIAFLLAHAASQKYRRKVTHVVAIPLCLLAVLFLGAITLGAEIFIIATTEVTDIKKYDEILDEYWKFNDELVSHFPRPIPSDAKDVRFSFLPGFLQGGAHVQLRYSVPASAISELYDRFSKTKTKSFTGGTWSDYINMKGGMPTPYYHTSGSDNHDFPKDFEIMVFDEVPKEGDIPTWNHGESHGVAISRENNVIVYWAESW